MEQFKALDILKKTRAQLEDDHKFAQMYDEEIAELEAPKSCEWINTNDEMPKAGQIVFAYMENDVELGEKVFEFHDVIRAVYYPEFHMECDGTFDGDCDYNEERDEYYWPEGWYEWNSVEDTHWMATKKAKLWMHIPVPKSSK